MASTSACSSSRASTFEQEDGCTQPKKDQGYRQKGSNPADIKVLIHLKNSKEDDQKELFGGHMRYPLIAHCLEQLKLFKEIIIFPQSQLTSKLVSDLKFLKDHLLLALEVYPVLMPTTGAILDFASAHINFEGHPFFLLRLDLVMDFPFEAMMDLSHKLLQKNIQFEAIMVATKVDRPWMMDEVFKLDDKNVVEVSGAKQAFWEVEPEANGEGPRKRKATSKGKGIEEHENTRDLACNVFKVTCYIPGPHRHGWINTRLYLMRSSVLELKFSPTGEIEEQITRLVERGTLYMLPHEGLFFDMPDGYEAGFPNFFSYMARKSGSNYSDSIWVDETTDIDPTCRLEENVIIGPGCEIEGKVELQRCIILGNVKVCEGAIVVDSVIGSGAILGQKSKMYTSVIAKGINVVSEVTVERALALASSVLVEDDITDTILLRCTK